MRLQGISMLVLLAIASSCARSPEPAFLRGAKFAPFEKGADGKLHCPPGYSPVTICFIDDKEPRESTIWCGAGF
jgi:hypothetical protein